MKKGRAVPKNIDEYIAELPDDVQEIMENIRSAIRKAVPAAEEKISYQMPSFRLNRSLAHFAAWRKHIGFYPTSSVTREFKKELSKYKGAKGSVQFPLDEPIPYALIAKIMKFRAKEELARAASKTKAKAKSKTKAKAKSKSKKR